MSPEIRIDSKLVCSNNCFRAALATEGLHDLDIYWPDPNMPTDTRADGVLSIMRPSFRVRGPITSGKRPKKPPKPVPNWLDRRLRIEQIVVGCSPLAQRLFSLVSDIITVSQRDYSIVSIRTLAETLWSNDAAIIDARDELIDAGALSFRLLPNPHSRRRPIRALMLPCGTRPLGPEERRETVKELLDRVRSENKR
jgi:hypothetical protein